MGLEVMLHWDNQGGVMSTQSDYFIKMYKSEQCLCFNNFESDFHKNGFDM